ncbi:MAG: Transcriptional regulator TrmB [Microgenomates group bacterium GW2011_GWA2_46_7]|nr:MAG: Transcriptional regulator TrmB [Microgenomates group bacterium GW2011_GWA2_46_7]
MSVDVSLLKQLGMEEKEAKMYLAALEFGPTTIVKLAKKSGIKRTTIYEFIDDMVARGLIATSISVKRTLYSASEPVKLEQLIEKQREIIKEILPGLESLAKKSPQRPRVRFYEGVEGIRSVYNDTLSQSTR